MVTTKSLPEGTVNSHGVWQVGPSELVASAPGGLDSILRVSVGGVDRRNPKLGKDLPQALRMRAQAAIRINRFIISDTQIP